MPVDRQKHIAVAASQMKRLRETIDAINDHASQFDSHDARIRAMAWNSVQHLFSKAVDYGKTAGRSYLLLIGADNVVEGAGSRRVFKECAAHGMIYGDNIDSLVDDRNYVAHQSTYQQEQEIVLRIREAHIEQLTVFADRLERGINALLEKNADK